MSFYYYLLWKNQLEKSVSSTKNPTYYIYSAAYNGNWFTLNEKKIGDLEERNENKTTLIPFYR